MLHPPPADVLIKPVEGEGISRRISAVRMESRYLTPATERFLAATREAAERLAGPLPAAAYN